MTPDNHTTIAVVGLKADLHGSHPVGRASARLPD